MLIKGISDNVLIFRAPTITIYWLYSIIFMILDYSLFIHFQEILIGLF